ncbi:unannotated protein [freshwater metagenome]|uniref:Unannotated protein n=1 Tax=freshwater metagenome TaxID=449393 RepID=A0A6J6MBN0_9ZZZZ
MTLKYPQGVTSVVEELFEVPDPDGPDPAYGCHLALVQIIWPPFNGWMSPSLEHLPFGETTSAALGDGEGAADGVALADGEGVGVAL